MLQIGTHQEMLLDRLTDIGGVLLSEDGEEVLIPGKFLPEDIYPGDRLTVFLYKDHQQRPIATTLHPTITLGDIACLRVKQTSEVGAFMDWGIEKDLLVPFREQKGRMREGEEHLVIMYLDERTNRLAASAFLERFLRNDDLDLETNEEVDLIIWEETDLGYNVIVNNLYKGLVYRSDIYQPLSTGDRMRGYVKQVRPDQKLDITLQRPGYAHVEPNARKILEMLRSGQGFLPFTDKSAPEDIADQFQMSKKTFKKALGALYRQRLVRLEDDGVYLV